MKFPLPRTAIPSIELTTSDRQHLKADVQHLLTQSIEEYMNYVHQLNRRVDLMKWTASLQYENSTLYTNRWSEDGNIQELGSCIITNVLAVGTLDGELEDVLYSAMDHSTGVMRVRHEFLRDKIMDMEVLDRITTPTLTDPFHAITLNWSVRSKGEKTVTRRTRYHDLISLTATGMTKLPNGEPIAYQLQHSPSYLSIAPFDPAFNILRMTSSLVTLYRQLKPGTIEVYACGQMRIVNPRMSARPSYLLTKALKIVHKTAWQAPDFATMKKLQFLLSKKRLQKINSPTPTRESISEITKDQQISCSICKIQGLTQEDIKSCRLCEQQNLCNSCCKMQRMCFISPTTQLAYTKSLCFCRPCFELAEAIKASDIAKEQVQNRSKKKKSGQNHEKSKNERERSVSYENRIISANHYHSISPPGDADLEAMQQFTTSLDSVPPRLLATKQSSEKMRLMARREVRKSKSIDSLRAFRSNSLKNKKKNFAPTGSKTLSQTAQAMNDHSMIIMAVLGTLLTVTAMAPNLQTTSAPKGSPEITVPPPLVMPPPISIDPSELPHGNEIAPANSPSISPSKVRIPSLWEDEELLQHRVDAKEIQRLTVIGKGAYGVVYSARYLNKEVVVKQLRSDKMDTKSVSRYIQEVKLMMNLDHPKICPFLGVAWTMPSDICMLLEYMKGGDLRSYLDTRKDPASQSWTLEKVNIAIDTVEALVYLHGLEPKILHRDLKARNVLLDDKFAAKLSDFGISRELHIDMTMTSAVGTSRWIAPELLMGESEYTEAVDVYSFGATLLEMDSHDIPFANAQLGYKYKDNPPCESVLLGLLSSGEVRPTLSKNCPADLKRLILDCLALDPSKRPTALTIAFILRKIRSKIQK